MNRKYIIIYSLIALFLSYSQNLLAESDSTKKLAKEAEILASIAKKHDLNFDKRLALRKDSFECVSSDTENHEFYLNSGLKLLNYYEDVLASFPKGFLIKKENEVNHPTKKNIIELVDTLSWCFQKVKSQQPFFIKYVRKMIDTKILNKKILYENGKDNVRFNSGWMNYSWIVSDTKEKIESRLIYDEKILKILSGDSEVILSNLNSYIIFSNQRLVDNISRPKILKYLKKALYKNNINFNDKNQKKDYVQLSRNYLHFILTDKNYGECINFINKNIKSINFSYNEIKDKVDFYNYKLNCLLNDLRWDESYDAYIEKINYLNEALENFEYEKETEIEIYNELIKAHTAIVSGLNLMGFSREDEKNKKTHLNKAERLINNYMKNESKYFYLILNKSLIDQYIYDLKIKKAEKNLNDSLIDVEKLTEKDGYPYETNFKDQKADLEASYLSSLSSIFFQTKRYNEAITVNKKIIESSLQILNDGWETNLDIVQQTSIEAYNYRQAYMQLFMIYNHVGDRNKQQETLKKISEFCKPSYTSVECLFFYQQKMAYATQIRDLELMNEAYNEMEVYYSKFSTENIYINYMTDTELLKHKVMIYAYKELDFVNDPKKKNSKEHAELRKKVCKEINKLEKKSNRIDKHLAKTIKNRDFKERTAYIKSGIYFLKEGSKCEMGKRDVDQSVKLFAEVIQLEKNKLDKWMNLPSNFYQYEVNTDLISQVGATIAFYKDDFDYKKNLKEYDKLSKEIFSLTQYGKNLYITNSIKNSINQRISGDNEIEKLVYERNAITTKLDLVTKDILNNNLLNDKKFKNKNEWEEKLKIINSKISERFPEFNQELKSKFYTVEDVQKNLVEGEVFIVFDSFNSIYAHIIKKNSYDVVHKTITMSELKKRLYQFRKILITNKKEDRIINSLSTFYELIFSKIEEKIYGSKKIIIISDKFIEDIPLGILYDKNNGKYLSEKYSISYQPSVGSFVELREQSEKKELSYDSVFLGVGDPLLQKKSFKDYIVSISDFGLNKRGILEDTNIIREKYENLPFTRKELKSISQLFSNNKILLSKEANEDNLKNLDLEKYDIISFATHAAVSGTLEATAEPFLVLTPPKKSSIENDGILTASEISQLNLNAKLVILSACNTAAKENEYAMVFLVLLLPFLRLELKVFLQHTGQLLIKLQL